MIIFKQLSSVITGEALKYKLQDILLSIKVKFVREVQPLKLLPVIPLRYENVIFFKLEQLLNDTLFSIFNGFRLLNMTSVSYLQSANADMAIVINDFPPINFLIVEPLKAPYPIN